MKLLNNKKKDGNKKKKENKRRRARETLNTEKVRELKENGISDSSFFYFVDRKWSSIYIVITTGRMVEGVLNVQVVEKDASEESKLDESCAKIIDQNMKSTKWETMG